MTASQPLTRVQIRTILKRHTGSITEVARRAGVKQPGVSAWLRGRITSRNIHDAAAQLAAELLQKEQSQAA